MSAGRSGHRLAREARRFARAPSGHHLPIRRGDRVCFAPGENHWHGAAPTRFMTHLAIHEADDSGRPVTWGEHVSDEQYGGKPAS